MVVGDRQRDFSNLLHSVPQLFADLILTTLESKFVLKVSRATHLIRLMVDTLSIAARVRNLEILLVVASSVFSEDMMVKTEIFRMIHIEENKKKEA